MRDSCCFSNVPGAAARARQSRFPRDIDSVGFLTEILVRFPQSSGKRDTISASIRELSDPIRRPAFRDVFSRDTQASLDSTAR